MNAARTVQEAIGLNRALLLCGVSKQAWYYTFRPRNMSLDPQVQEMIQKIGPTRPTYGTGRMAVQVSKELNHSVNRKAIRCMFKRLGWNKPSRTKRETVRANKIPRPNAPNRFWDLTCPISGAAQTAGATAPAS